MAARGGDGVARPPGLPRMQLSSWLAGCFPGADSLAPSTLTREPTGWQPTHPGLVEDLEKATTSARRDLQADRALATGRMAARMP